MAFRENRSTRSQILTIRRILEYIRTKSLVETIIRRLRQGL